MVAVAVVVMVAVCSVRRPLQGPATPRNGRVVGGVGCGMQCSRSEPCTCKNKRPPGTLHAQICSNIYCITLGGSGFAARSMKGGCMMVVPPSGGHLCFPRASYLGLCAQAVATPVKSLQRTVWLPRPPVRSVPGGVTFRLDHAALGAVHSVRWAAVAGGWRGGRVAAGRRCRWRHQR